MARLLCAALAAAFIASTARAQGDIPNSTDHPLVGRYAGAVITFYKVKDYEETVMPKAAVPAGPGDAPAASLVAVKGKLTSIRYKGPAGRSALETVRNYQEALAAKGFSKVFECRAAACGSGFKFSKTARQEIETIDDFASMTYALMKLDRAGGAVWVSVFAVEQPASGSNPATPYAAVRVVEEKAIETGKIELVKADKIGAALAEQGKIALYAIEFDLDSDAIRPSSDPQIAEIAAYLKKDASARVMVVGHTDTTGAFDYNRGLSERRAAAVVKRLTAAGVAAGRLTAFGAGPAAPVASNRTEESRAKNRRVEIVDYPSGR
jgi:outer membrane protein OmpA-like peptidoglycan-associated protein